MPLSDATIRNLKPRDKDYRVADEKGLYLQVSPAGGRLWRMKYRTATGSEKKLAFGAYPEVSLKAARDLRDEARKLLAAGIDPAEKKKQDRHAAKVSAANSFVVVAHSYIAKCKREGRAEATTTKQEWLLKLLDRAIGQRPIAEIQPFEMLEAVRRHETTGRTEAAHRALQFASQVFRFAIANQLAASDPTRDLRGALTSHKSKHHAAILEPRKAGELLRAIDGYDGHPVTRYALQLAALVFVRPGELRHAEWSEIDSKAKVWRIPAEKMKARAEHVVPLSEQALDVLAKVRELTGDGQYVFPSIRTHLRPMSENTVNAALRRLGYASDEMTGHGFRAMASTLLNESGKWSPDAIERALAHKDKDAVRAAYHRGAHWQERVDMAQWWADFLDTLRTGAEVVPITAARLG
ncbi:tyrosine-type recombinase/integrase [Novosphingobium huizhouense]|uniref:tyrosine-type recombinase/integrase n=1 Tax=Novosphingobium huizhouense TaxID=2866625 RepID=UPI001CD8CD4F|nr:integrase arm-type DNA-binding domain-containing protein [Novosphingobium huizhouense]